MYNANALIKYPFRYIYLRIIITLGNLLLHLKTLILFLYYRFIYFKKYLVRSTKDLVMLSNK